MSDDQYELGTWEYRDGNLAIDLIRPLTLDEFDSISADLTILQQGETNIYFRALLQAKHYFDSVFDGLNSSRARPQNDREFAPTAHYIYQQLYAALAGVLSTARMYFDATANMTSMTHGRDSELFDAFQKSCRAAYDSSQEYRFCELLRNVFQHFAAPLALTCHALGDRGMQYGLLASPEAFLSIPSARWTKSHRKVLEDAPREVDVYLAIGEYFEKILQIEDARVLRECSKMRPTIARLLKLHDEAGLEAGVSFLLTKGADLERNELVLPFYYGPSRMSLERVLSAVEKQDVNLLRRPPAPRDNNESVILTDEAHDILRAFFLGDRDALLRKIDTSLRSRESAQQTIIGLFNVAAVAMSKVDLVLGVHPLEFLNHFGEPPSARGYAK